MLKRYVAIFLAVLVFPSCERNHNHARKGQPPSDSAVDGYDQTRWGMPPEQVQGIYKDLQKMDINGFTILVRESTLGSLNIKINFLFDKTGLLKVKIEPVYPSAINDNPVASIEAHGNAATSFQEGLSQKYGTPSSRKKEEGGGEETIVWFTETTKVEFYVINYQNAVVDTGIWYSKRVPIAGL